MSDNINDIDIPSFLKKAEEAGRLDEAKQYLKNRYNYGETKAEPSSNSFQFSSDMKEAEPYDWMTPALGVAGLGALVAGAKKVYSSISDRKIDNQRPRVEPTMDVRKEPTFSPPISVGPANQLPGTPQELEKALGPDWEAKIAKSDAIRKEKQMVAQERARTSMGEFPTQPITPPPTPSFNVGQPPAPPVAPPIEANPVAQAAAQTAPVAPPTVAQLAQETAPAVTTAAQAPAAAIPPVAEEKNKGGRPKKGEAKQWTYDYPSQLPEGTVFKEGWGGADNWLNDQVGKEKAKEIRNTFNQGRGFGSGKDAMLAAAQAMQDAGQQKFMTQGEPFVLSGENRERFGIPPPKQQGRLSKTFEKGVKVGGVTGLLLTAAEAANAKQAAQNIGEALLPIGMTPSELASGKLTKKQLEAYTEFQKLGSPYRQR
jgi:hypothetical protein